MGSRAMLLDLKALISDDKGASIVEYGLIVALIAVAVIVVLSSLGTNVSGKLK
jgi:Flp pilus assembly pilin Flp